VKQDELVAWDGSIANARPYASENSTSKAEPSQIISTVPIWAVPQRERSAREKMLCRQVFQRRDTVMHLDFGVHGVRVIAGSA
jgi:hypothetical protein